MIDPVGGAPRNLWTAATTGAPPPGRASAKSPPRTLPPEPALSPTARAGRGLAAAPPVDTAHVAAVRTSVAAGSYRIDAGRIADRMIAADWPR